MHSCARPPARPASPPGHSQDTPGPSAHQPNAYGPHAFPERPNTPIVTLIRRTSRLSYTCATSPKCPHPPYPSSAVLTRSTSSAVPLIRSTHPQYLIRSISSAVILTRSTPLPQ